MKLISHVSPIVLLVLSPLFFLISLVSVLMAKAVEVPALRLRDRQVVAIALTRVRLPARASLDRGLPRKRRTRSMRV